MYLHIYLTVNSYSVLGKQDLYQQVSNSPHRKKEHEFYPNDCHKSMYYLYYTIERSKASISNTMSQSASHAGEEKLLYPCYKTKMHTYLSFF